MRSRLVRFHLSALASGISIALALGVNPDNAFAAAGWDCHKSNDGKDWVCTAGGAKSGGAESRPKPAPEREPESAEEPSPRPLEKAEKPPVVTPPAPPRRASTPSEPPPLAKPAEPVEPKPRPVVEPPVAENLPMKRLPGVAAPEASEATETTATAEARPSGWTCKAGNEKNWDCGLVGPDPKGMPHKVGGDGGAEDWSQATTMTDQDEQRFKTVMAKLPDDPWRLSCGRRKNEQTEASQFILTDEDRRKREKTPLDVDSDYAEFLEGEVSNFRGSADLARADQRLFGDFVTHNNVADTLNAQGNVVYREKGLSFGSDSAYMRLGSNQGVLRNTQFVLETVPARGTARRAHIDSKSLSRYQTVTYTTCPPGDQDWLMHADTAKLNKETGRGIAKNAWLQFKGVPILWSPFLSFPIDDRRQSGFLTPFFGYTKIGGFDFTLPYYFNLDSNYDATIWLREVSNRGQMVRGEFRYLTEMAKGFVGAEYMPYDDVRKDSRGLFKFTNDSRFTPHWKSRVDLNYVTDARYLNELGNILNLQRSRFMRNQATTTYADTGYAITAAIDHYISVDPQISKFSSPYTRLPQLVVNYGTGLFDTGLTFDFAGEAVNFAHRETSAADKDGVSRVTAQRLNLKPRLSYPIRGSMGYLLPSLTLQHTEYWLDWPEHPLAGEANLALNNNVKVIKNQVSRTAPIFSVDSGLFFDKEFQLGQHDWQHTIEPRLYYLYVPKVTQNAIPNFDSGEYDLNFYQVFRDNRFIGVDRLADSNQITPAITSRFIDQNNGLERFKLSLGQIFYFRDREIQFNNRPVATNDKSNVIGELSSMLSEDWSLKTTGQWNPYTEQIDRAQLGLYYNNKNNQLLNISYRYRRDPSPELSRVDPTKPPYESPNQPPEFRSVNQTDITFRLPVTEGWNVVGRWQYSLLSNVTTQTIFGVEKETCCWRFSLIGLRYLNGSNGAIATGADAIANNAVFFQLEFKGLSRLGDQVDRFLARNISGYRLENEF